MFIPAPPPPAIVAQAPATPRDAAAPSPRAAVGGFANHLLDAIAVNARRAAGYARQSAGRSWPLSVRLIAAEALLVPTAWGFDGWGESFRARGVVPVTNDFAPMTGVPEADRPVTPFRLPAARVWGEVATDVAFYGEVIRQAAADRDFRLVCQACEGIVAVLDRLQTAEGLPMPMTRHVVESIGYGAAHAVAYGRVSQGATDGLYAQFLGFQAQGIGAGIALDRDAASLHADGVGFLLNDLPPIPFREAWEAVK